ARRAEQLDTMIVRIGDEKMPSAQCETSGLREKTRIRPPPSPRRQELSVHVEFLDAAVPLIAHVERAGSVRGDVDGTIELAFADSVAPDVMLESPLAVEDLHAVVARVRNVDAPVVGGDAERLRGPKRGGVG